MADSIPYAPPRRTSGEMQQRARRFREELETRRSVRSFSPDPIPAGVLEDVVRAAASAPSGANMQPWTFVVVREPALKRRIREAAEEEERRNYEGRMSEEWLDALAPLGTDWRKEFLEIAPALIVVFRQEYGLGEEGAKIRHYYVNESVGIASGFLLAALHNAGLATLTHTPSPMGFLRHILDRPANEKAFLLIPVGYPAEGCRVPAISRKPIDQVAVWR
ncbi:MAG: nitroreductase family protein [Thermoanaerobaculia bacterium]